MDSYLRRPTCSVVRLNWVGIGKGYLFSFLLIIQSIDKMGMLYQN